MTRPLEVCGAVLLWTLAWVHAGQAMQPVEQTPVVQTPPNEARPLPVADAGALAEFNERVTKYAELHKKLEATLPRLSNETTPQAIDTHQRALERLIRAARKDARQGDILTAGTRRVLRQLLARVFAGKDGQELKATILDDNPGNVALVANSRYPDQIPFSTVPPQVLASLPPLPEELEYRFIGERMILLDVHAHTVADFMNSAFPRAGR